MNLAKIHLIIRGALGDAVRPGLISRNVALVAHAPRLRSIPRVEPSPWTADELRAFLRAAAGHGFFDSRRSLTVEWYAFVWSVEWQEGFRRIKPSRGTSGLNELLLFPAVGTRIASVAMTPTLPQSGQGREAARE